MTRDRKSQMLADARRPQRIEGPTAALRPTSHVVVGFDRCPASHHALRFAIELAAPLNAYLHVAHIIELQDFPVDPDGDDWEQCFADTLDQERATACDLLSALPGNWTYYAHRGDPAHVLAALADTHDAVMIILGTARGGLMSAIDRFLGVSVSARLIHHTRRPVVLVPDTAVATKLKTLEQALAAAIANCTGSPNQRHLAPANMADTVIDNAFTHVENSAAKALG